MSESENIVETSKEKAWLQWEQGLEVALGSELLLKPETANPLQLLLQLSMHHHARQCLVWIENPLAKSDGDPVQIVHNCTIFLLPLCLLPPARRANFPPHVSPQVPQSHQYEEKQL